MRLRDAHVHKPISAGYLLQDFRQSIEQSQNTPRIYGKVYVFLTHRKNPSLVGGTWRLFRLVLGMQKKKIVLEWPKFFYFSATATFFDQSNGFI